MDENYQDDENEYDFTLNEDKVSSEQIQLLYRFACIYKIFLRNILEVVNFLCSYFQTENIVNDRQERKRSSKELQRLINEKQQKGSFETSTNDNNNKYNTPQLPKQRSSKNIYSIVESVFPEHKYPHNQRTTYVERYNFTKNRVELHFDIKRSEITFISITFYFGFY